MYKYYVDNKEVSEKKFFEDLEEAVDAEVEEHFDDLLDECYPEYKIGYLTFTASQILSECDPVAYRCALADEQSARYSDYEYDFRDCENSDFIGGRDFETVEVDDEEEESDDEDQD